MTGDVGRVSAQHLVRTDSREQKLDAFLVARGSAAQSASGDDDDFNDRVRLMRHQ